MFHTKISDKQVIYRKILALFTVLVTTQHLLSLKGDFACNVGRSHVVASCRSNRLYMTQSHVNILRTILFYVYNIKEIFMDNLSPTSQKKYTISYSKHVQCRVQRSKEQNVTM